ncbi:DNA ligase [Alteromonas ponticola]|uniref:DNA ligase n=1 Tax=Alteromonas ponticola TaxID=2720613 RepID=A0ABX1R6U4_9ALTE|nr:DNA ligase [Alteromonas ponticola]NMH60940.1 DNA ligase [Alteromonas ponticola]
MMLKIFTLIISLSLSLSLKAANQNEYTTGPFQLAERYKSDIDVKDYFVSEKLDGVRARWTGRELLTRKGNKLYPPAWFTQDWPAIPMDGELWSKRGDFERIASIVLTNTPDHRWREITMMLFDLPILETPFSSRVSKMKELVRQTANPSLAIIPQFKLPSTEALQVKLDEISDNGGEGVMLHHQHAFYQHGRNSRLLKAKRFEDDEARVLAHIAGKGKFRGMMGSLLVETKDGVKFKIGSGFSQQERKDPPPLNSWITFKYYGLTKRGVPRFASYLRLRPAQDNPAERRASL